MLREQGWLVTRIQIFNNENDELNNNLSVMENWMHSQLVFYLIDNFLCYNKPLNHNDE